ncbi:hypothetical protein L345_08555, partial [Ophiophagus hannah]
MQNVAKNPKHVHSSPNSLRFAARNLKMTGTIESVDEEVRFSKVSTTTFPFSQASFSSPHMPAGDPRASQVEIQKKAALKAKKQIHIDVVKKHVAYTVTSHQPQHFEKEDAEKKQLMIVIYLLLYFCELSGPEKEVQNDGNPGAFPGRCIFVLHIKQPVPTQKFTHCTVLTGGFAQDSVLLDNRRKKEKESKKERKKKGRKEGRRKGRKEEKEKEREK